MKLFKKNPAGSLGTFVALGLAGLGVFELSKRANKKVSSSGTETIAFQPNAVTEVYAPIDRVRVTLPTDLNLMFVPLVSEGISAKPDGANAILFKRDARIMPMQRLVAVVQGMADGQVAAQHEIGFNGAKVG